MNAPTLPIAHIYAAEHIHGDLIHLYCDISFLFFIVNSVNKVHKINYPNYYQRCMTLVKSGGVIVLDNMLWGGTVLNPKDEDSKAIRETGKLIQHDNRCFNFLLPISYYCLVNVLVLLILILTKSFKNFSSVSFKEFYFYFYSYKLYESEISLGKILYILYIIIIT